MSDGKPVAKELLYARRLTTWVLNLEPHASEALRLAARCQHICRWKIPRSAYPSDRAGYLRWRNELKKLHADLAGNILRECGYSEGVVQRVQELNLKRNFPSDPESRVLEDALCLVFLQYQFEELAAKTAPEKVVNALRKSWAKMTEKAREAALKLPFSEAERALLEQALRPAESPRQP